MADFILSATTMNFDGLSSLCLRNVTTYVFATSGRENSEKGGQSKGGRVHTRIDDYGLNTHGSLSFISSRLSR